VFINWPREQEQVYIWRLQAGLTWITLKLISIALLGTQQAPFTPATGPLMPQSSHICCDNNLCLLMLLLLHRRYILLYSMLGLASIGLQLIRAIAMIAGSIAASRTLHNQLMAKVSLHTTAQ
jgi:hypothetical protein